MRLKFLFALGFVLGASMASGEVTIRAQFQIDGIVTSVSDHGALNFSAPQFDYRAAHFGGNPFLTEDEARWRRESHAPRDLCRVAVSPKDLAFLLTGRRVKCDIETPLDVEVMADCHIIDQPKEVTPNMLFSLDPAKALYASGLAAPLCPVGTEGFLVAVPPEAFTSEAGVTWMDLPINQPDYDPFAP